MTTTTLNNLKFIINNVDSFTSYKEKIENEIGAKGYIGELILSGVTPNFQRIPLTGTVAEREL